MLTVNMPDQAQSLIERLGLMPKEAFEALRAALGTAPPNLRIDTFNEQVKKLVSGIMPEMADLVDVITQLSRTPRDASVSVEELASSIVGEILKRKGEHPDPALLESRLSALLGIPSLKLWAKASNVQHQYEEIFSAARIISDIRTVFEADGVTPLGAMVVHNLKITSIDGRHQFHDRFLALDNADLEILQEVLQRARGKAGSLEGIIMKSGLTYFQSK
jgi:hypothetical protein